MTNEEFIVKVLSIAKIGLMYSKDNHALENYAELERIGIEMLDKKSENKINENIFVRDIYPTPNLSVRIMIVDEKDNLLFVKERKEEKWGVPGGWCDLFISAKNNALKEVSEEVGLDVEIDSLLAIFNREKYRKPKEIMSDYVIYFLAKMPKDQKVKIGFEVSDAKFMPIDNNLELSYNNTKEELLIAWDVYKKDKQVHVD